MPLRVSPLLPQASDEHQPRAGSPPRQFCDVPAPWGSPWRTSLKTTLLYPDIDNYIFTSSSTIRASGRGLSELDWASMKLATCPPHPRVLGARVSLPGKSTCAAGFPTHRKSPARDVQALFL